MKIRNIVETERKGKEFLSLLPKIVEWTAFHPMLMVLEGIIDCGTSIVALLCVHPVQHVQ